jgi:hypothetical protein
MGQGRGHASFLEKTFDRIVILGPIQKQLFNSHVAI